MVRRRLFTLIALVLTAIPAAAEPLRSLLPRSESRAPAEKPWWLEADDVVPAEFLTPPCAIEHADGTTHLPPWQPTPPPAAYAGSQCNFNVWCGDNIFSPDFSSCQVLLGAYRSRGNSGDSSSFGYVPFTARYGWMLTAPDDHFGFLSSNWECLADLTTSCITSEWGSFLIGPSIFLRQNYFPFGTSFVPYTQVGIGLQYTDAYTDDTQKIYGESCNWQLHAQIGLRYFVTDKLSLDIEGGIQHLSNANFWGPNRSVNAFGATIGFTYHFPSGGQ